MVFIQCTPVDASALGCLVYIPSFQWNTFYEHDNCFAGNLLSRMMYIVRILHTF